MHSIAVVANPSKLGSPARTRDDLRRVVEARGARLRWYETTVDDPGRGPARQALADGAELVCALGGDGTVGAVAAELAGGDVPLGILPGGTGNVLARNLHNPVHDISRALVTAIDGTTRHVDMAWVTCDDEEPRPLLVMGGAGLDATAMAATLPEEKKHIGWLAYALGGLRELKGDGFEVTVTVDGRTHQHGRAREVLVGNCGTLPVDVPVFPGARLDDGVLDVMVLAPHGPLGWRRTAPRMLRERQRPHRALSRDRGRVVEVQATAPVPAEIDGDGVGQVRRMVFRVEQGALPVRVAGGFRA